MNPWWWLGGLVVQTAVCLAAWITSGTGTTPAERAAETRKRRSDRCGWDY